MNKSQRTHMAINDSQLNQERKFNIETTINLILRSSPPSEEMSSFQNVNGLMAQCYWIQQAGNFKLSICVNVSVRGWVSLSQAGDGQAANPQFYPTFVE